MRRYELTGASSGIIRPGLRQWSANYRQLNDKVLQLPCTGKHALSWLALLRQPDLAPGPGCTGKRGFGTGGTSSTPKHQLGRGLGG